MPRVLVLFIAAVVACAVAVAGAMLYLTNRASPQPRLPPSDAALATGPVRVVPGPGQSFVTGSAVSVLADGALGGEIPAPFTLTASEPGAGSATIEAALVNGQRTSIEWGGGTPLPITWVTSSGGPNPAAPYDGAPENKFGGLDLGAATAEIGGGRVSWSLADGVSRNLRAGRYRAGSSVAIGVKGLATPRDGVEFTADAQTVLTAQGRVVVRMTLGQLELTGPGRVAARGDLELVTPTVTRSVSSVEMVQGPFRLSVKPGASGRVEIDAVLQGPLSNQPGVEPVAGR